MATAHFSAFYQRWLLDHQTLLDELNSLLNSPTRDDVAKVRESLVERVMSHYSQYYDEKSLAATRNPFVFFSPPWLTPYERTLLWICGFKPSVIFRLVAVSVGEEMTAEQKRSVEEERAETGRREQELTGDMAHVQESIAAPPIYALMRESRWLIDGEVDRHGAAVEALKGAMRRVMEEADAVRGSTARRVLEILTPAQRIKFLATAGQYLLEVRRWGFQSDSTSSF